MPDLGEVFPYLTSNVPCCQMRRILLIGVPALFRSTEHRLAVATPIAFGFLLLQTTFSPYALHEHNLFATLGNVQITATLVLLGLRNIANPVIMGWCCLLLNVLLAPVVLLFIRRRLKRRRAVLQSLVSSKDEPLARNNSVLMNVANVVSNVEHMIFAEDESLEMGGSQFIAAFQEIMQSGALILARPRISVPGVRCSFL